MRTRSAVILLASLSGCAFFATGTGRAPESPAQRAQPVSDPGLQGAPAGPPDLLPVEQVSVRVQRASDGRVTIVEFLSPGLPESEQVALRLAYEAGKLRLVDPGATGGEQSWITALLRPRGR
jgi:hypothetical protein